jgi:Restriction endonuclease
LGIVGQYRKIVTLHGGEFAAVLNSVSEVLPTRYWLKAESVVRYPYDRCEPVAILAWSAAIAASALAALIDMLGRARRLRRQRALSDLAALSWQQFEEVIADAFRRHGYRVRETSGRGHHPTTLATDSRTDCY